MMNPVNSASASHNISGMNENASVVVAYKVVIFNLFMHFCILLRYQYVDDAMNDSDVELYMKSYFLEVCRYGIHG